MAQPRGVARGGPRPPPPLSVLPQYNTYQYIPVCLLQVNITPPKENLGYALSNPCIKVAYSKIAVVKLS